MPSEPPLDLRATGRPLRVLITRPDEQAEETAQLVRRAGGEPLVFPCLHRAPPPDPSALRQAVASLPSYGALALTSANAAKALLETLAELRTNLAAALDGRTVALVGSETQAVLEAAGLPSSARRILGSESTGEGLAAALVTAGLPARRVLFLRAAEAQAALPAGLRAAGIEVTEVVAYAMSPATAEVLRPMAAVLADGAVDLVPFGSPRTAAVAIAALGERERAAALLERTVVGAIGPTTAAAVERAGIRVDVVAEPATFSALLAALAAAYTASRR